MYQCLSIMITFQVVNIYTLLIGVRA